MLCCFDVSAGTPSPSQTASNSGTPSQTPSNQVATFQASGNTVVVLRGGSGAATADNVAVPLFLDEIAIDPEQASGPVTTVPIRTAASGAHFGCVGAFATGTPDELFPSNTVDGTAIIFPCNAHTVGQTVPAAGGNSGRIVAVVFANGTVDTRTRVTGWTTGGNQRGYFRSVASTNLWSGIYVMGYQGGGGAC